jgi:serine/threonine protein kinase
LESLAEKGVHHRDIAPNNLLVANGKGLLIDLDFASVDCSTFQQSNGLPRTGHKAYMSISELEALREGKNREHAIRDDIESLFYCLLLEATKGRSHASLKNWSMRSEYDLLEIKKNLSSSPVKFRGRLDISLLGSYRTLMNTIMAWYEALFISELEGYELVSELKCILEKELEAMDGECARRDVESTCEDMKRVPSGDVQESPDPKRGRR